MEEYRLWKETGPVQQGNEGLGMGRPGRVGSGLEKLDQKSGQKVTEQKEVTPNCTGVRLVRMMVMLPEL